VVEAAAAEVVVVVEGDERRMKGRADQVNL
jgi:hypothetical protein